MYFTIIYMLKNLVKNNYKSALITTFVFMLLLTDLSSLTINSLISLNLIYSFAMYFGLFIIAFDSLKSYKIIGTFLLISIFFLPPNIFSNYKGLLFPVTYLSFITYIGFIVSKQLFTKWKKNQVL
tara:strand:- start:672 stop:1046 length:375 start_codon:yes stop_codon:yes gene_type:complete